MIEQLRAWLSAVIVTSVLVTAVQSLIPEGTLRRIASMTGGLILLLVLLQPLTRLEIGALHLDYSQYTQDVERQSAEAQDRRGEELKQLIEQRTAAYILDKAGSLGISCTVSVTAKAGENGLPRPYRARLSCAYSEALSRYLSEELEIPEERQAWNGREA